MANQAIELEVTGMTCDNCVRAVERKLSKTNGVTAARVHLKTGKAEAEFDDQLTGIPALLAAVQQVGYGVRQI